MEQSDVWLGDHYSCYRMSTVPVKEKLEAVEEKGDRVKGTLEG